MAARNVVRIGGGAGFSGDRLEPAVQLADRGALDDLVLECLAERTIALAQRRWRADPDAGYDPLLERRFRALLPTAARNGVRIITNMGAANPVAAGERTRQLARELSLRLRVAVVTGDDVLEVVDLDAPALEDGRPLAAHGPVISANAYLGADALLPALATGAEVVLTGRVADPSLTVAPLVHRFGWDLGDWQHMAAATLAGHLLECGGQVTGGYFADPGSKDVPGLDRLGFPLAEVAADGSLTIGKLPGTGGLVSRATVREQLLYEVTDPAAYLTPDVCLDLTRVRLAGDGTDRVRVDGAVGRPRPDRLKVSVGYHAGYRGEGEISYVGPGAARRARLAAEIVTARLPAAALRVRVDAIAPLDPAGGGAPSQPEEYRLRVTTMTATADEADLVGGEVEALYTNGPAGGGGVRTATGEVVGIVSTLVPRDAVTPRVTLLEPEAPGARHAP